MIAAIVVAGLLIIAVAGLIVWAGQPAGRHRADPPRYRVDFYPQPPPLDVIEASLTPFPEVPDFPPPFLVASREKLASTGELRALAWIGDIDGLAEAVTDIKDSIGA
jgi:hypothetical protein